jgi:hypothetical protein
MYSFSDCFSRDNISILIFVVRFIFDLSVFDLFEHFPTPVSIAPALTFIFTLCIQLLTHSQFRSHLPEVVLGVNASWAAAAAHIRQMLRDSATQAAFAAQLNGVWGCGGWWGDGSGCVR